MKKKMFDSSPTNSVNHNYICGSPRRHSWYREEGKEPDWYKDRHWCEGDWAFVWQYAEAFQPNDVASILLAVDGEHDETNWTAIFKLNGGKFGYLTAGCDYTGWDCRAWGDSAVGDSFEEIWFGHCTDDDRSRLKAGAISADGRQFLLTVP